VTSEAGTRLRITPYQQAMKSQFANRRRGFSLLELLTVVVILGLLAAIILPRISSSRSEAAEKACYHNRLLINSAIEKFALDTGNYPTGLSDLNVPNYFPDSIPTCPVSGHAYTINGGTNRVNGHAGGVHP
jgi:prepilin-type N-terminal cleavage/methylation domain-containing protein